MGWRPQNWSNVQMGVFIALYIASGLILQITRSKSGWLASSKGGVPSTLIS